MSHNPASILLFTVQGLLASLTCGLCCYLYSYCYNGRFFKNGRGSNRNNKKRSISSVEGDFPNSKKCKKGHINHECSNNKEENKILIKEDGYETYDTYKTHDIYKTYDTYKTHDIYETYDTYKTHDIYETYDTYKTHDIYETYDCDIYM
ncbi:hypothetical protein PFAG_01684 [Plasmodium falciparum Santa Lucia]|uniref:Uncharacterized protein n=1 Tax=Plasmodium falciparum Santa Lucia TaxID=478859 RepID=W7G102_PLAFA|nr:hypothetical protein PFAG_01684 [Plasmodium falciparum Santa Lucia]